MATGIFMQMLSLMDATFILLSHIGREFAWLDPRRHAGTDLLVYVPLQFSAGFVILEDTWTGISPIALLKALLLSKVSS